jgi:transposase
MLRTWQGQPVPPELQQRLVREYERWQLVDRQIKDLTAERARRIRTAKEKSVDQVRQLLRLRGIGPNSAWLYVMEFFGWCRCGRGWGRPRRRGRPFGASGCMKR